MKAETEKPLSPEFQANRSMFRQFPESRQIFGDFDIKMAFDLEILKNDINKKSMPFDRNDDTNREI